MKLLRACGIDEIDPGDALKLLCEPPIAVFNVDGEFYATQDTCTHGQSSLSDGYLDGDIIECSWHMGKFCVRTGDVVSMPPCEALKTYPVVIKDGAVFVQLESND
ncbi:bifunctional 3-phenylpropionate/cinnamic acid dioxygenase ferredoxin subunit [Haliea sp.]